MRFSAPALCLLTLLVGFAVFFAAVPLSAQVAGQNVNMVSGTQWPNGDPFLQRQNEPSMAVSTRNPMHVLAGANDYRTVDLELALSGGAETGDAWLGIFKSFDGGLTWQSTLLPGCSYATPQCKDSGALSTGNYQAGADPVVRAGTNGMFYFAGLAFDRATGPTTASSVSTIFVARYNDLNNNENIDPITYIDTHIVASGNSTQFLDKPAMAVDIPRSGAQTCSFTANEPGAGANGGSLAVRQSFAAGNVYVAYTDFLQATKANSTPTHLMFTRSTDCGVTWSTPVQINTGTTTSQGSAIAVNPLNGNVYVAWRQFASTGNPDAIMVAQSTNAGKSFSAPVRISTFQPFDQGTTGTSFRTNAYPALTTDMFGFVYVAFSARGMSSSGDARIVAAGSLDGTHWTPAIMVDNPSKSASNPSGRGHQIMPAMTFANGRLTLLYYDLRLDHYAGVYTPNPSSRGDYVETLQPEGELAPPNPLPTEVFTNFIDDAGLTLRRHTLDLRVLELGIFPTVTLGPSVLVSQYDYGCCVNPESPDIEQFKFNVPNLPLFELGEEPFLGDYIDIVPTPYFVPSGNSWAYNFMPSVNPLFHATWTDNRDVVPPPPGGSWENYTPAVPKGTFSTFQPGSSLPSCQIGQEGMRNQNIYTAQITGGLIVGAPGNAKQLGTTTFNGKTVPFQRAFPVEAQNVTAQPITVRFTIASQPAGGSASFLQFSLLTTLDVTIPANSSVSRSVFATSTNAQAAITVNVAQVNGLGGTVVTNGLSSSAVLNPDITNPNITNPNITNPNITNPNITNAEVTNPNITNPNITNPNITNPGTENLNITNPNITNNSYLNPNITNPNITNENVDNVSATNPNITNPNITNPNITNPNITNPNITNPNITNPDITNGSISDVIYPITNNGNTTASYTVKTAINGTVPGGIVLQLIVNKLYQTPVANNCVLGVQTHWVTVANIVNPKLFSAADPNITNPDITNGTPNEASVTLAPGETAYITVRVVNPSPATIAFNPLAVITPVTVPQAVNTTTVLANPGNPNLTAPPVYSPLAILTPGLPATDRNDTGYSLQLLASGGKPGTDTWTIVGGGLPGGINMSSTGLVAGTAQSPGSFPVTVQVADSSVPPNVAIQNYTLNVSVTPLTEQTLSVPPDGIVGQPYGPTTVLVVTGGTTPYVWTATGLPPGLSINAKTGQVSGTPTAAVPGGSSVTITATDAAFPAEAVPFTTTIRTGDPLAIGPATLPSGAIGTAYTAQLTASGGIGGYVFGPAAPAAGVTLSSSGQLTIADPQSTTLTFSVTVHDSSQPSFQTAGITYTVTFTGTPTINVQYITQPPNYVEGQPNPNFPVHIHVQDNQGGPIAGVNVTMSFNGTPPCSTAVLNDNADTLTQATSATGDAFFTFMTISRGGVAYTLKAAVGAISAISNAFNVSGYCDTGSMNTARHSHIVLTLPNGKTLITGGAVNPDGTGALNSAELYDPVAQTFTTIAPMNVARVDHTMTLLNNGTVLVAGGFNDTGGSINYTNTAEIFDPTANTFTLLPATMTTQRGEHTATLLANGTVLLLGGNTLTATLSSGEIYDPVAQTFTAVTQQMSVRREIHHADMLTNGKVLITGGFDPNNNALATAEIYDPVAQTFTVTPGSMTTARGNHAATLLYNGQVLVAGGLTGPGTGLTLTATAELFNPTTGTFTPTGSMSVARGHYTAPTLSDGTVFIPSGATLPGGTNADIYDPATGVFTATPNFTATSQSGFREGLLHDGTVLLASGLNSTNQVIPNSERYYPVPVTPGIVITTPQQLPTAFIGQPYTLLFQEHGGVGPISWLPSSAPPGMAIANGILTGTPVGAGSFEITMTVMDSSTPPQLTVNSFVLTVENQLLITTTTLPSGLVGVSYNAPIVSTGGEQPVSFSLPTTAFPPGLTITQPGPGSQTGALAGTPTTPGTYSFSESVADSSSPQLTATQPYTVTIANPIAITTTTLPNAPTDSGTPAIAYNAQIQTSGGLGGLTFAITNGTLPPGITLNSATGALTATSVTAATGTYSFTVQVTSAGPPSSTASAVLSIKLVPFFIGASPNTLPTGTVGTPYSFTISSTGGVPPFSYGLSSGTLPPGLTLNSATTTTINLSGTPTTAGTSMFFISASDSSSPPQGYEQALTVTINNPAGPLAQVSFSTQPGNSVGGQTISGGPINVFVSDGSSNPISGVSVTLGFGTAACGAATLGGGLTAISNASGIASFSGISVDRGAAGYTLQATAQTFSAVSNAFNVSGFCQTAGNMNSARDLHTATLLNNGQVLVAGGQASASLPATNTAEVYTASSKTFAPTTGPMNAFRVSHTATLLADGTVLLAGGSNNGGTFLASAELYNPATGTFTLTESTMNNARQSHSATLLGDGTVLIAGGTGNGGVVTPAEIYNPTTQTFTTVGNMVHPREFHTATLLPNGNVLIAGGLINGVMVQQAEIYNPTTKAFTASGNLLTARQFPTATLLKTGMVLIAGGLDASSNSIGTAELFNPANGTFTGTGNLITARGLHTATTLAGGTVLLAGGFSASAAIAAVETYDPVAGTFSAAGGLANARYSFVSTLLNDGTVLATGGGTGSGVRNTAEVYLPSAVTPQASGTWAPTAFMHAERTTAAGVVLANGQVLMTAGFDQDQGANFLNTAELFNPLTQTWTMTGLMNDFRASHAATLLQDGTVLVSGGVFSPDLSAETYDPTTGTFTATGNMVNSRLSHTATLLNSGQVLLAGGAPNGNTASATAELYNPTSRTFSATANPMNVARFFQTATLLSSGKVLVAGGDTCNTTGTHSTAELYDPTAGTFTAVPGGMTDLRCGSTATLLANGTVLITGGGNLSGSYVTNTAEIFNPTANGGLGGFTATSNTMNSARADHAALLLPNGKVLVVSGNAGASDPASAELYDPVAGTFTLTGSLSTARDQAVLVYQPTTNQVLIIGGGNIVTANTYSSTEIYVP